MANFPKCHCFKLGMCHMGRTLGRRQPCHAANIANTKAKQADAA
jgi:hypothetical protein